MKGSVKLPVFIDDARKLVNTTQLRAKYLGASYEAEYCQWQTLHGLGSLMETASLIITPNAYLEGKLLASYPPDPIGDFDVTRATTATRVNSAGLVELVPYNLFGYSEDFANAYWTQLNVTINTNTTTAPNGTLTADNAQFASGSYLGRTFTHSGVHTFSVYAKYIGTQWLCIENFNGTDLATWFNIQSGTIGTIESGVTANIESVGNGWYRCSITMNATSASSSIYAIFNTTANGGFTRTGSSYLWGAQLVEGSVAKDYQKTETRLNIPRLDYSNGTCPSILVEPQRTNYITYSSSFSNWLPAGGSVTENTTIAPDGTMTADTLTGLRYQTFGGVNTRTFSCYAKANGGSGNFWLRVDIPATNQTVFDLTNGTYSAPSGYTASIEDVGNGWYRCSMTTPNENIVNAVVASADYGANSTYIWGAQLEVGSYATSYIPTTSASVTRNADVISKTGISSLIGQTEGTLFLDIDFDNLASQTNNPVLVSLFGNAAIYLQIFTSGYGEFIYSTGAGTQAYLYWPSVTNGHHKIAFGYKANDFVLYVDGVQVATDTSGSVDTLSSLYLGYSFDLYNPSALYNSVALWKTRLTNAQLATLTTI